MIFRLLALALLFATPRAASAGAISGTVQNVRGDPLADATVRIAENSNCQDQSGSDGAYLVAPAEKYRRVTLIYEKPGYIARCVYDVENKNQKRNPMKLVLRTELDSLSTRFLQALRLELIKTQQIFNGGTLGEQAAKDLQTVDALAHSKSTIERMEARRQNPDDH